MKMDNILNEILSDFAIGNLDLGIRLVSDFNIRISIFT